MDFARVLMVAIVIFAVFLVFFGGEMVMEGEGDEDDYNFGPIDNGNESEDKEPEEAEVSSSFFAGKKRGTDYKYFTLTDEPFTVDFKEERIVFGEINRTDIAKGFLTDESRKINFNLTESQLDKVTRMDLNFTLLDSNYFGELLIELNDNLVYSKRPSSCKEHRVEVNESLLEKHNELRISSESSGFRFWVPSIYQLKDFQVGISILGREIKEFTLPLKKKQADDFYLGRLVLNPKEFGGYGPLVVQANGEDVYRKTPENRGRPIWIDFKNASFVEGENTLSLFTGHNASYKFDSADFVYFWQTDEEKMTTKTIHVTSEQYSDLPGEISFTIDKIEGSPESLDLRITDDEGEENLILIQETLREGKSISMDITKNELSKGENTIEFVVEGDGGFYISDFEVDY